MNCAECDVDLPCDVTTYLWDNYLPLYDSCELKYTEEAG